MHGWSLSFGRRGRSQRYFFKDESWRVEETIKSGMEDTRKEECEKE